MNSKEDKEKHIQARDDQIVGNKQLKIFLSKPEKRHAARRGRESRQRLLIRTTRTSRGGSGQLEGNGNLSSQSPVLSGNILQT